MSTTFEPPAVCSLADTLSLALSQCQEQVRHLGEQSRVIDDLRHENNRLRKELEQCRSKPNDDIEARYRSQFHNAFKQIAEKQLEIDTLRERLRAAKTKARQRGSIKPASLSPSLGLGDPEQNLPPVPSSTSSVHPLNDEMHRKAIDVVKHDHLAEKQAGLRKRQRSTSPLRAPLQEVSVNVIPATGHRKSREEAKLHGQFPQEKRTAAISELAEDGEEPLPRRRKTDAEQKGKLFPLSVYNRLGDLLETRSPTSPLLTRARSNSPPKKTIGSTTAGLTPLNSKVGPPSTDLRPKRPRSSMAGSRKMASPDFEDDEPFRSRPMHRLGLMHFKLNPAANEGLDYAYNQVIRGRERRCLPGCTKECCVGVFRALASTLPNPTDRDGRPLSDDNMLLEYLGTGSEGRIKNLTAKARENLLHDARVKLVADSYGKMHRDVHERGKSPPGFWRTDMPGSQEERQDREKAKIAEREEVSKRYNEALKEGGRWLFADE